MQTPIQEIQAIHPGPRLGGYVIIIARIGLYPVEVVDTIFRVDLYTVLLLINRWIKYGKLHALTVMGYLDTRVWLQALSTYGNVRSSRTPL